MTKLYKLDGDTKREFTDEEYAQAELDKLETNLLNAQRLEREEKKNIALNKLQNLGIDIDDLKALGLG